MYWGLISVYIWHPNKDMKLYFTPESSLSLLLSQCLLFSNLMKTTVWIFSPYLVSFLEILLSLTFLEFHINEIINKHALLWSPTLRITFYKCVALCVTGYFPLYSWVGFLLYESSTAYWNSMISHFRLFNNTALACMYNSVCWHRFSFALSKNETVWSQCKWS